MKYVIGIDDHDSYKLGCTTHFSIILLSRLIKYHNVKILDLPYLVRLNPNIPWKTRGNASIRLAVEFNGDKKELADIVFSYSIEYIKNVSFATDFGRKPGVAVIAYEDLQRYEALLNNFYIKAVSDVIPLDYTKRAAEKANIEIRGDRGIIGSVAALGVHGNYTYELITYRKRENWLRKREIDDSSVREIDDKFFPMTFANYDYIKKKPIILSHGNDPVLYGIRGTSINVLLRALKIIKVNEDIDFFAIFKSNQGTDIHFKRLGEHFYQQIKKIINIDQISVIQGGDVIIKSTEGDIIFVYKETGELNQAAKELKRGDKLEIYGSIKPSIKYKKIIELERFKIIELNDKIYANPICPKCGKSMESMGKGKGFRCKKCRYISNLQEKVIKMIPRTLSLGVYQSRYYRHLTRPLFLDPISENIDEEIQYISILEKSCRELSL